MPTQADVLAGYGGLYEPYPEPGGGAPVSMGDVLAGINTFGRGLAQADVALTRGILGELEKQAKLPGDVYSGTVPYLPPGLRREDFTDIPPEVMGRSGAEPLDPQIQATVDLGANLIGMGTSFAQPGSAGIFGGRLGASPQQRTMMEKAEELRLEGMHPARIIRRTGIFHGPEGKARFEIPDIEARFKPEIARQYEEFGIIHAPDARLGDVLEHPKLFEAYPGLRDVKVRFEDPSPKPGYMNMGAYDPGKEILFINPAAFQPEIVAAINKSNPNIAPMLPGLEGMRSTMLHELQHIVQFQEGFARGGTPWTKEVKEAAATSLTNRAKELQARVDEIENRVANFVQMRRPIGPNDRIAFRQEFFKKNPQLLADLGMAKSELYNIASPESVQKEATRHYNRLGGEVESRNIQYRADMTPEQLAVNEPWMTQEVPFAEQLIRLTDPMFTIVNPTRYMGRPQQMELPLSTRPQYLGESFRDRMVAAQEQAFADRQSGRWSTAMAKGPVREQPPLLAPGETRGDVAREMQGPGPRLEPTQPSIADVGRAAYRGFTPPPLQPSLADVAQGAYREALIPDLSTRPTTEMTPIGEQFILPGAERLTPAEMAKRKAAEPLRAEAPQQPPGGLFGDLTGQGELDLLTVRGGGVRFGDRPVRSPQPANVNMEPFTAPLTMAQKLEILARQSAPGPRRPLNEDLKPDPYYARRGINEKGEPLPDPGNVVPLRRPEDIDLLTSPMAGIGSPYLRNPNAPLFDYARLGERIPTAQFGLQRTQATEVTPDFARAASPANIRRVNRIVEQGIKEGGLDWHNLLPLQEEYIAELGSRAGPAAFTDYIKRVGATSPNSNVMQNFRTASYYDYLIRNGLPLPEIQPKPGTGNPYIPPGVIPYPYGNTAQGLHVMNLNALAQGGYPLSRPKPPSFAENLLGNYTPVAIDRHNLRLWGIDREAPNLTGYRFLEDLQQREAARMGIDPAQYQAAGWLPYAESGNIPALKLFEDRIRDTAEVLGLTKEQVLREFIRGQMRLQ